MAAAAGHRHPQCHVLNFFFDKYNGCALTVLVNGVRFHIIADASKLRAESGPDAKLEREYHQLLTAVKQKENSFTRPCSKQNLRSRNQGSDSQDSGHGTGDEQDMEDERDSAVDVKSPSKKSALLQQAQEEDPDEALNNWMLSPFGPIFDKHAPEFVQPGELSLQEWYERPSMFFSLEVQHGELRAVEEDASEDLEKRMVDIIPKMYLPKYIRKMEIPWYPAEDIIVIEASDDPAPYHPTRVRIYQEEFFLKMVDPTQPSPTKREIELMKKAESLELHQKLRIPLVKGLVSFQDSKTEIMGFLQTAIQEPIPLTHMLDDEVSQRKRDKWAKESERIKEILHENGIVWGDAKADNFMVDKNDHLWIIDFGGSYTDGWVDPELMETVEGDDMGVKRIVNALQNPDANAWDDEAEKDMPFELEEKNASAVKGGGKSQKRKRKAGVVARAAEDDVRAQADTIGEASPPRKRARKRTTVELGNVEDNSGDNNVEQPDETSDMSAAGDEDAEDQKQYCICNKPASGDMIGCDNNDCHRQWFHFECVGLGSAPKSKHWFCDDCREDSYEH